MNTRVKLTKRENEIAELLAWGATQKEIASMLFISEYTVANTARNIYEKLEINKATELASWWFCTKFQIPFSLSPLLRKTAAAILLAVFTGGEFVEKTEFVRRARIEITEHVRRTRRCNRNREEEIFKITIAA